MLESIDISNLVDLEVPIGEDSMSQNEASVVVSKCYCSSLLSRFIISKEIPSPCHVKRANVIDKPCRVNLAVHRLQNKSVG